MPGMDGLTKSLVLRQRSTYLYRALDSFGQTNDIQLCVRRDATAAKRLFRKALASPL